MESLSRRQLLGVLGAGAAGLAGGGYWYLRGADTLDCPEYLEPDREFRESTFDAWSEPVVDDGTVFVGGGAGITRMSSGSRMFRLLALEPSGEPKWVARREFAGGIGRPRPTDDRVFASTGANTLLAFDRETGGLEWEFDAGGNVEGHMGVATLVHDDTVVASVNDSDHDELEGPNAVVGVSTNEGEPQWMTELDAPVSNGLALFEGTGVVATRAGTLTGVDPATGDRVWEEDLEGSVDWTGRPVSFAGNGWIPREDGTVVGFDPLAMPRTIGHDLEIAKRCVDRAAQHRQCTVLNFHAFDQDNTVSEGEYEELLEHIDAEDDVEVIDFDDL